MKITKILVPHQAGRAKKTQAYPIMIGVDFTKIKAWLPKSAYSRVVIITDHHVKKLYGIDLQKCFHRAGYLTALLSFPAGEKSKTMATKIRLENKMQQIGCDRNTLLIALGGGVVGDLAGFIAATYYRGIDYIQIPTTLLAMVDSSVGGKTGINTAYGKNLIGAFYQPRAVIIDPMTLATLPKKHRINGLIEALKMFLTHDANSWRYVEQHLEELMAGNCHLLEQLIVKALRIKTKVVADDPNEAGSRSLLNFGHTIGHALEHVSHYRLLHGIAVAYGILLESMLSEQVGLLPPEEVMNIQKLLMRLNIHRQDLMTYDFNKIMKAAKNDKKIKANQVRYVLLNKIGKAHVENGQYIHAVATTKIQQAFKRLIKV